jgi:hypothetical protein
MRFYALRMNSIGIDKIDMNTNATLNEPNLGVLTHVQRSCCRTGSGDYLADANEATRVAADRDV